MISDIYDRDIPACGKKPFPSGQDTENTADRYFPVIPVAYVFRQKAVELAPTQNCSMEPSFDEVKTQCRKKPVSLKLVKNKKKIVKTRRRWPTCSCQEVAAQPR
jgi:hypothetical protein